MMEAKRSGEVVPVWFGKLDAFSLTPALSRWERENRSLPVELISAR
jgi:hypothetical protein